MEDPIVPFDLTRMFFGTDPALFVSIRRRPLVCLLDQTGFGTAFGLRGFGAHFLARRSKLSSMRPISA